MKDKEVIKLLRSLKGEDERGGDFDFQTSWNTFARRYGFTQDVQTHRYTLRDYFETYIWMLTHSLLKPLAAAAAVFVFAVVGSLAMAGASTQALPGDTLYPVRIGLERAQLTLAWSADQRAGLRVEFASRRLEEMVALAAMTSSTTGSVQLAADRFKDEMAGIREELFTGTSLPSEASAKEGAPSVSQKEFAKTVGRKVEVYSSTVATTKSDLSEELRGEVEQVLEETKEQVVSVIITAHEAEQDEESAAELDEALDKEITSVEAQYGEAAKEAVATAQALREEGLYRRAFQVLKDFTFEAGLAP